MDTTTSETTILLVDDEQDVADAYTAQLQSDYDTRTAYGGEDALERVDDEVDVVTDFENPSQAPQAFERITGRDNYRSGP
ncbi:hypothetical protein SAMN05216226_11827 [Halovenus aranensis]|uniref:Response regulatory domain-containing protein n=1 Tax=Halovenus aranensis TaxID=890420 RepID=A0A1G8Z823_9EURY|nr:hypothetical protein [Halovenus aranensis]SDK10350.1 hypothetical protein SAMN05216226_11827 [Halovenus aranensis]